MQRNVHDLTGRAVQTGDDKAVDRAIALAQRLQRRVVGEVAPVAVGIHAVSAVVRRTIAGLRMGLAPVGIRHRQRPHPIQTAAVFLHVGRSTAGDTRDGGFVVHAMQRDVHALLRGTVEARDGEGVDRRLAFAQRLQCGGVGGESPVAICIDRIRAVRRGSARGLRMSLTPVGIRHRQHARSARVGAVFEHVARRIASKRGIVIHAMQRNVHKLLGGTVLTGDNKAIDGRLALAQRL